MASNERELTRAQHMAIDFQRSAAADAATAMHMLGRVLGLSALKSAAEWQEYEKREAVARQRCAATRYAAARYFMGLNDEADQAAI